MNNNIDDNLLRFSFFFNNHQANWIKTNYGYHRTVVFSFIYPEKMFDHDHG